MSKLQSHLRHIHLKHLHILTIRQALQIEIIIVFFRIHCYSHCGLF